MSKISQSKLGNNSGATNLIDRFKGSLPLIYLIVALLALRWTFIEPYVVPTGSMEPTLKPGDRLYALKCAYDVRFPFTEWILFHTRKVKRGDVILFRNPQNPSITFVKRALALGGDKIRFEDGAVFVNGAEMMKAPTMQRDIMYDIENENQKTLYIETLDGVRHYAILENRVSDNNVAQWQRYRYHDEIEVPAGHLFAVGDNRDNSHDSRAWGFVPVENLKGRAMFIWFSSWDPNIPNLPFSISAIPEYIYYFFRYLYDLVVGEAHVRTERIGTLIQ